MSFPQFRGFLLARIVSHWCALELSVVRTPYSFEDPFDMFDKFQTKRKCRTLSTHTIVLENKKLSTIPVCLAFPYIHLPFQKTMLPVPLHRYVDPRYVPMQVLRYFVQWIQRFQWLTMASRCREFLVHELRQAWRQMKKWRFTGDVWLEDKRFLEDVGFLRKLGREKTLRNLLWFVFLFAKLNYLVSENDFPTFNLQKLNHCTIGWIVCLQKDVMLLAKESRFLLPSYSKSDPKAASISVATWKNVDR